ncbi:MAG: aldehyde dehydrogenase family protein [Elusimicrobia bacterium]|nr:aldehyde dehydrogenase family protein [Elusimicrobiota bacterium]
MSQALRSPSTHRFPNIDPATGQVLGTYVEATPSEVDVAVEAAQKAYLSWRKVPAPKRGEILLKAMELLKDRKEALARTETREMGKVLKEARGDVQEAIDTAFYYAGEGRRLFGQTTPSELSEKFCLSIRSPIGVCALITPWNFPIAIPSWKIFPALLCGNTVILKPSSDAPESAIQFVRILQEAGVPEGAVNLVLGRGSTVGAALTQHPQVRLVSFTGSSQVGASIGAGAAQHFKKCSLEMGGKNAQIVMEDADLDLALEGALWGAFGTTGQRCTATSRVIVHREVYQHFTERLVERAQKIRIGNGLQESTEMGPLVNEAQLHQVQAYVEIGKNQDGARLLCGGKRYTEGACADGFFYAPTLFGEARPQMRIAQEEIFGPVVCLIPVRSFEEALETLNHTEYGLSGSIYTRDVRRVLRAIQEIETGITYVNAPTIGAEVHLPFGGVKHTGNGHREAGTAALDIFSEWKAVYIDYSGRLQKAQIDS